jgi:DNA-binding transcriptional LysR family regulator
MHVSHDIHRYHTCIAGAHLTDLSSLNLNLLVALDALLSERSVTRAGRKIGLAQSSMSHALASLRDIFADPLLVRSAEGMVPTPRARELEAPLRRALEMLAIAIDTPAPFDPATATSTFGLASDAVQQVILLPDVLRALQERAPGMALHTEAPVDAEETYRKLASGELDFAIGHFDDPPGGVHRRHLATDHVVYVARKGHPRISRTLSKAAIGTERLLLPTPITSGEPPSSLLSFHQSREQAPGLIAATPHVLASLLLVSQTDVITGTIERVAEMYKDALGLAVFPSPVAMPPVDTHIVWHDRTEHSPAHLWLLDLLVERARASAQKPRRRKAR